MPVHIRTITVKGLGPLTEFQMNLGSVNLIYGKNEQGKTHLVDFIMRSLFKKSGSENTRPINCTGEIQVTGVGPALTSFTTKAKNKKLEDYLPVDGAALPPGLSRLLVVRAGEFEPSPN